MKTRITEVDGLEPKVDEVIRVGVTPASAFAVRRAFFQRLGELYGVTVEACEDEASGGFDGVVFVGGDPKAAAKLARQGVFCLVTPRAEPTPALAELRSIQFGESKNLPGFLRGRLLPMEQVLPERPLVLAAGDEIAAALEGRPAWTHRLEGLGELDVVGWVLPAAPNDDQRQAYLGPAQFTRLLPLLNFFQRVAVRHGWRPPPLRACFVFDDPNLHRRSYGHLNYRFLVKHAHQHDYHAGIATIPLDASSGHAEVLALFRSHPQRLSLLIHGNNHVKLELLHHGSEARRLEMLAEALRRIHRFESRHGLRVCRVMEPPHGVVSADMLAPLNNLGYEAVLVSSDQALQLDPHGEWPATLGLGAVEHSVEGLCLIPRIYMSPHWRADCLLAAFLHRPVVLSGHHEEAADKMHFLEEFTRWVNGFGSVQWLDPSSLARSSYSVWQRGEEWMVRAGGRRLDVDVPEGVRRIVVERAWLSEGERQLLEIVDEQGRTRWSELAGRFSDPLPVGGPARIALWSPPPQAVDWASVPAPPRRLWPFARKQLMSVRDRVSPWLPLHRDYS